MAIRCTSCNHEIQEDDLPRLADVARVLCPECHEPLTLPEMTLPLSLSQVHRTMAEAEGMAPDKKYALLVLSGSETGRVIEIDKELVTIGRSGCDVILDDPELSRRHARIRIRGAEGSLEDMGSTNGTFVGKDRIQESVLIENRSKFRVGGVELAFVVTERSS
jgi:pSer/pThr/pTyr-binding forkhead associated (FHA) protein